MSGFSIASRIAKLAPVSVLLLLLNVGADSATIVAQKIRGITVSTHRGGEEWASDAIVPTFASIEALGANWVAIHPYGRISADGSVRFSPLTDESVVLLQRPIQEAHELGLKILIKPHLAYWRSPFSWRGEIDFDTDEAWTRFWSDYEKWILALASVATEADAFAVGTELDRTLAQEQPWRGLIGRVRKVYEGPLTYAANWSDYQRVPFWDALDAIGIQAYFPLTEARSPNESDLREGWDRIMEELHAFSVDRDRYIVFTELGYNRSLQAAQRPWEPQTDGDQAIALQEACTKVALEAVEREQRVVGAFLWKWFPEPRTVGRDFQLAAPGMRRVLAGAWRPGSQPEPPASLRVVPAE